MTREASQLNLDNRAFASRLAAALHEQGYNPQQIAVGARSNVQDVTPTKPNWLDIALRAARSSDRNPLMGGQPLAAVRLGHSTFLSVNHHSFHPFQPKVRDTGIASLHLHLLTDAAEVYLGRMIDNPDEQTLTVGWQWIASAARKRIVADASGNYHVSSLTGDDLADISNQHALFGSKSPDTFYVGDDGSTNGTQIFSPNPIMLR